VSLVLWTRCVILQWRWCGGTGDSFSVRVRVPAALASSRLTDREIEAHQMQKTVWDHCALRRGRGRSTTGLIALESLANSNHNTSLTARCKFQRGAS
jgi:hypothetical protein